MSNAVGEPVTARGRRTRALLVAAAAEVFAEKRYLATNIADIVTRAGVAHGTFYRYFDSKEQIFSEVALDIQRKLLRADADEHTDGEVPTFQSPSEELLWRISRANLRYLSIYRDNRRLMAVLEQVATFNDEMRAMRRETRTAFVERAQRSIERMQAEGLAHRDLDARYAANALGAMVDRFCYVTFVLDEPFELEEAARTLSVLWARSLGLDIPEGEPVRASRRRGS
jgi:AcrR family transcriptional regulator